MKKTAALLSMLLAVALLLSGCAQEQIVYQEVGLNQPAATAVRQADILNTATNAPSISIALPEDEYVEPEAEAAPAYQAFSQPVVESQYAGATPIPLDPVDMPTPTPRPDVTFEYETYQASIGYSFEAPVGWEVTQDDSSAFVLTDPEERDGVNGQIRITVNRVDSGYKLNQVKSELTNQLNEIKRNYVEWRIWSATSRKLMDHDGYYNTWRGVAYDGTVVRGLIHITLADRRLITISFTAPGWYNNSYTRVYNRIRSTMK